MRVLSKEESFERLKTKFIKLSEYDIIDLCYENERFPAVVVSVDYVGRAFEVVPLTKALIIRGMLNITSIPETKTIQLPDSPADAHPSWNIVGK